MEKPIVFTNLPHCNDLFHILVSIDPNEKKDKSVKSDFQWQILKTRLLLFSEKNVIASPAAGMLRYIHVATRKEYFSSGGLAAVLQKLRLKVESIGALSFVVYEECLLYNFVVKLAPLWNKVEKYFIGGRYFLMQRGALHAIELHIVIKEDMLLLYASPLRVWLREVSLSDLLPASNLEETLSKPFFLDLFTEPQWVHVLPSFKRGHLVYVTNHIPKESTFEDYLQIRRHWKNVYGYRLPVGDSPVIYVGISFFNNKYFMYPLECVRRGMHMNTDEYSSVVNFAKAVSAKSDVICGNRLKLLNLMELQSMPTIKISNRPKWSKSTLAELDSELLNKWLCLRDDSFNQTVNSQDVSLYTPQNQCEMDFQALKEDLEKKHEHESWLTDCSHFINHLAKGCHKRSFLKACRPSFNESCSSKSSNEPDLMLSFLEEPLPCMTQLKEDGITMEGEMNQIQNTLYKPCFNKIGKPNSNTEDNSQGWPVACISDESTNKGDLNLENKNETSVNTISDDVNLLSKNKTSILINLHSSTNVGTYKPVFKKKRQLYHPKGMIEAVKEEGKKVSKRNVKDRKKNEKQKNKTMGKMKHQSIEDFKEEIIKMASKALTQEMTPEVKDGLNVNNSIKDMVTSSPTTAAENKETVIHEKVGEHLKCNLEIESNQNKLLKFNNSSGSGDSSIKKSQVIVKELSTTNDFAFDANELPMLNRDIKFGSLKKKINKRKSDQATGIPKERKKNVLLSAGEIEKLVSLNQLEKANVLSLSSYLKLKRVPFSKNKKEVLIEKVKKIVLEVDEQSCK